MLQNTLKQTYSFEGKGLHTGRFSHITIKPAAENTGIIFKRTDLEGAPEIAALAENVSNTARSTVISHNGADVHTIEHLMSALTGLGVDNAIVEVDNVEIPILTGSAEPYVQAVTKDGLQQQSAERQHITIDKVIEVKDEKSGSCLRLEPADEASIESTVDFGSKVLGVQTAHWNENTDYASEIAPCRTFVFFHEIEFLFANNLIKGGDVDNAIVIVEHPVEQAQLDRMSELFHKPKLQVTPGGYLSNLKLHFPDECGRHKLLDLIGDLRLSGGYLKAKVTAFKPGHGINTRTALEIRKSLGLA